METRRIRLADLLLNSGQIEGVPKNPRFIRSEKYKKLVESIKEDPEMLELRELLVYPFKLRYVIIGGNMRYRALKELGYTEAVCKVLPEEFPKDKLRRVILKDNASFGEINWDSLLSEWAPIEIDAAAIDIPGIQKPKAEEQPEDDGYKASEHIPQDTWIKNGDLFRLGEHVVLVEEGWSDEAFPLLLANYMQGHADMLVCDVANIDGETGDIARAAMPAVREGAACYVWHGDGQGTEARTEFAANGMEVKQTLVWRKRMKIGGHKDYNEAHAACLYGSKKGAERYFCKKKHLADVLGEEQQWEFSTMTKTELTALLQSLVDEAHPSMVDVDFDARNTVAGAKPIPIVGDFIANSTRKGDKILDLAGDAGETLIAAQQLGRRCRTVVREPKICDVIVSRWEAYTDEKAVYLGNINNVNEEST